MYSTDPFFMEMTQNVNRDGQNQNNLDIALRY